MTLATLARRAAFAMAAVVALGTAAGATTIKVDTFGSNAFGHANAKLTIPGQSGTTPARVGAFDLKEVGGTSVLGRFTAFCVDVATVLKLAATYDVTPAAPAYAAPAQKADLQRLFDTAYATIDLTRKDHAAGFQLAIWEILFENGTGYDVTKGGFRATGDVAKAAVGATTFANGLLANLGGAATGQWRMTFLISPEGKNGKRASQNLVTVAAVPLPAAGLLLLGALGGIAVFGRRKAA